MKKIGGYDIAIDEIHYEEHEFYFRFTLAEELSHILLHAKHVAGSSTLQDVQTFHQSSSDEDYKNIEQQARALASQLLLPGYLFDDYILNWVGKNISSLRSSSFFSKNDIAEHIAENTYKSLKLSKDVVLYSIMRFPDSAIDKTLLKYGQGLIQ